MKNIIRVHHQLNTLHIPSFRHSISKSNLNRLLHRREYLLILPRIGMNDVDDDDGDDVELIASSCKLVKKGEPTHRRRFGSVFGVCALVNIPNLRLHRFVGSVRRQSLPFVYDEMAIVIAFAVAA